ncbi:hypothetical protein FJZ28_01325 [Candidatus Peregrinibacteria bacterium]|nr:hypothetical protein [Candidatus Peregrinibacteria bacterium]
MSSPLLIAFFFWQLQAPRENAARPVTKVRYQQEMLPTGELTVTEESPDGTTVPPGAQRVPMLRLRMTASCAADVSVDTVRVLRKGLGSNADISAVYFYHRGSRISQAREIANKNGSVDFALRTVIVPACETEELMLYADFSATASAAAEHRFELADDGVAALNANVRIDHRRGAYIRKTSGAPVGQIAVGYLDLNQSIRYGSRRLVLRFTLEADSGDDQVVSAITFTNQGSARDEDLQNVYVDFRARSISTVASSMDDDTVRVEFSPPLLIERGQKLSFGLRADVRSGYSRTVRFVVEEPSDIQVEPKTGR